MADADIHPTDIVSHVIDPVRCRLAELLVGEVMDIDLLGPALGPPLTAAVPEVCSFFLVSTEITSPHLAVDIAAREDSCPPVLR